VMWPDARPTSASGQSRCDTSPTGPGGDRRAAAALGPARRGAPRL